jgi:hypothetical protein
MLDGVIDLARSGRMPAMRSNDGEPAKGDVIEGRLGRRTGDFGAEKAMVFSCEGDLDAGLRRNGVYHSGSQIYKSRPAPPTFSD